MEILELIFVFFFGTSCLFKGANQSPTSRTDMYQKRTKIYTKQYIWYLTPPQTAIATPKTTIEAPQTIIATPKTTTRTPAKESANKMSVMSDKKTRTNPNIWLMGVTVGVYIVVAFIVGLYEYRNRHSELS